jgi:cytochrome P450
VGANLARAELQEALSFLAQRVAFLEVEDEPRYGTSSGIYGLQSLPLRLLRD